MANMEGTHVAQLHLSPGEPVATPASPAPRAPSLRIVSGSNSSYSLPATVAVNMTFGVLTFLLTLAASRTQTSYSYRSMAGKNSSSLLLLKLFFIRFVVFCSS